MDRPSRVPPVDPVIIPDLVTDPHPAVPPVVPGAVGPVPVPQPGLADTPGVEAGFKPLEELAKPEGE